MKTLILLFLVFCTVSAPVYAAPPANAVRGITKYFLGSISKPVIKTVQKQVKPPPVIQSARPAAV